MNYDAPVNVIHTLPKFDDLSPYWKNYFLQNDQAIQENFWGNLAIFKEAELHKDPYIKQQKEMGYCFKKGLEKPASFYQALAWVFKKIHFFIEQGTLHLDDVIWPARTYVKCEHGLKNYCFKVIGEEPPQDAEEVNLVPPHVFVEMISRGFFPFGSAIREHTNQCLAEHDLAHYGGFISSPSYMRAVRQGFKKVFENMQNNQKVRMALQNYDSVYSLRLYYMIEVFTIITESKKSVLKKLLAPLNLSIDEPVDYKIIVNTLKQKARDPVELYQCLYRLYERFNELVEPLGGESRDILNRVRKFNRASRLGTFFSKESDSYSKFDGSSIYSLYFNGRAALENKRSTHPDFLDALSEIHAPFIGALIGTSQLTVEDWVLEAAEEIPNPNSKLYRYLCKSGMWSKAHLIYWAYGCRDFTRVLSKTQMQKD